MSSLDAFLARVPGSSAALARLLTDARRGGSPPARLPRELAALLSRALEADGTRGAACGALAAALLEAARLVGPAEWLARNVCLRAAALVADEAARALRAAGGASGAGAGAGAGAASGARSDGSLAAVEAEVAAAAAAEEASAAASRARMAAAAASSSLDSGAPPAPPLLPALPPAAAGLVFAGALRDGVLDGAAEAFSGVGTADGFAVALGDLVRPGDAVLLLLGAAGRSPGAAPGAGGVDPAHALLLEVVRGLADARPVEVWVPEGGPGCPGHALAGALAAGAGAGGKGAAAAAGARPPAVVVVDDATALAATPRVSRALLPAAAVARDGSVVAPAGALAGALAASAAGVPVYAIAAGLAVCPEETAEALLAEPGGRGATPAGDVYPAPDARVAVLAPAYEAVPAALIAYVVTEVGAVAPSGVGQLAREAFDGAGGR